MPRPPVILFALALASVLAQAPARADDGDLLSSVYTENGYELRQDARVFALFAALNTAGFSRADTTRELPFPRLVLHPIREKLRTALQPFADKLRPPVDIFLDTHPLAVERYVEAALALGDEPEFAPTDASPADLKGLEKVLADFAKNAKLAKLSRELTSDYRNEFKRLRGAVDRPFAALRGLYRLSEEDAPPLVLMPNPLDASTAASARRAPDGTHVVVFGLAGPDRPVNLKGALDAYARLLATEAVAGVPLDGVRAAVDALKAGGLLAEDVQPLAWLAESMRLGLDPQAGASQPPVDVESWAKKGYVLVREFVKAAAEPESAFPADQGTFAAQVVARADLKKAVAELVKPPEPVKAPGKK